MTEIDSYNSTNSELCCPTSASRLAVETLLVKESSLVIAKEEVSTLSPPQETSKQSEIVKQ